MKEIIMTVLNEMKIEVFSIDETLRFEDDLGMDSQEIMEFRSLVGKKIKREIPEDWISRDTSIGDFIQKTRQNKEVSYATSN